MGMSPFGTKQTCRSVNRMSAFEMKRTSPALQGAIIRGTSPGSPCPYNYSCQTKITDKPHSAQKRASHQCTFLFCCNPLSVGRFNGGPIDGVARQQSDTQQLQDKDCGRTACGRKARRLQ